MRASISAFAKQNAFEVIQLTSLAFPYVTLQTLTIFFWIDIFSAVFLLIILSLIPTITSCLYLLVFYLQEVTILSTVTYILSIAWLVYVAIILF